jgi:ATP-dependent helicase IRC3
LLKNEIGVIKQQLFNIQPKLVVASVQTIVNRLDKIPADHFDLIVVDECHRALSNSFSTVLNYFTPKIRLGLSGTPFRLDGLSLGDLFDKIIIDKDLKFGIDNGFLCEIEAIQLKTNINLDKVGSLGGDLNQSDLRIVDCPERNLQIVEAWLKESISPCGDYRRKTIGFCVDVEHTKNLCQTFIDAGVKATFVVSDEKECPNRKERVEMFENGEYDVMLNIDIFIEGADFKDIGMSIAARPTKSKTIFLQGPIGRATRLKSDWFVKTFGGQNAKVLDVTDNCKKHSLINTWTLEGKARFEDRVFMGAARKANLIEQRDKRKLEHTQEKTERYNLLSLPQIIVQMHDNREPSEAMMNFLKGLGLYVEGNHYTWGQVSELISNSPAGRYEMEYAIKHGYDVSGGMSKAVFGKVKAEVLEKLNKQAIAMDARFKNSPFIGLK